MKCVVCSDDRLSGVIDDNGWTCNECYESVFDCVVCDDPIPFDEDMTVHGTDGCDKVCHDCQHSVTIEWGDESWRSQTDVQDVETYTFTSQEERDAFLLGIEEGVGWQGYKVLKGEKQ